MRIDDPNEPTYENQFDGGTPTEAEAKLIEAGLDSEEEGDESGTDDAAATAAKEAADAAAATAAAEAAALAATEAAASAAVKSALEVPAKPEPPKDFSAELASLEEQYDAGNLTVTEFMRKQRELTLDEVAYSNAVADWERQKASIEAQNKAAVEDSWTKAALAFEAANADFLSNPLRQQVMQNSIAYIEQQAAKTGERLTDQQVLDKALAIAVDYTGYKAPEPAADDKDKINDALKARRKEVPGKTLGDVPQANVESHRGDATAEGLDALPIDELEIAVANMSQTQLEKYLRSAPGAEANGRG